MLTVYVPPFPRSLAAFLFAALVASLPLLTPLRLSAQVSPPHRFYGVATVDGQSAAAGVDLAAVIDGSPVATATVSSGGAYLLDVVPPAGQSYVGRTIAFRIGQRSAVQTATWEFGGYTNLNLTAVNHSVTGQLAALLNGANPAASNLVAVWGYDSAARRYTLFAPTAIAASDLTVLVVGQGHWVRVQTAASLVTGFNTYSLAPGWNLIGWVG